MQLRVLIFPLLLFVTHNAQKIVALRTSLYIGRLPVYCSLYNYLLLPWILDRIFEKSSAKIIMLMAMGFYMVFYYYQMHIIWGL